MWLRRRERIFARRLRSWHPRAAHSRPACSTFIIVSGVTIIIPPSPSLISHNTHKNILRYHDAYSAPIPRVLPSEVSSIWTEASHFRVFSSFSSSFRVRLNQRIAFESHSGAHPRMAPHRAASSAFSPLLQSSSSSFSYTESSHAQARPHPLAQARPHPRPQARAHPCSQARPHPLS